MLSGLNRSSRGRRPLLAEHSGIRGILILQLAAWVVSSALAAQYTPEMLAKEFRLAVCMVGQVARTEIDSKIENLVKPNIANSTMHMFLILQQGEARFTNKHGDESCIAAPETLEDAKKGFERHVATTAMEYVYRMYDLDQTKWPGYPDTQEAKKARLTNHINQWNSWRKCVKLVEADEVRTGKFYNAVLRIRDNAIVLEPFNVLERLKLLAQQASQKEEMVRDSFKTYRKYKSNQVGMKYLEQLPVLTKACSAWKGVNDKLMLVPRKHMHDALGGMANEFYLIKENTTRTRKVANPEKFVKWVLDKHKVPRVAEQDPALLPITDGRCETGDRFCVVQNSKDCRPPEHSWPVKQCKLSYGSNRRGSKKKAMLERMQARANSQSISHLKMRAVPHPQAVLLRGGQQHISLQNAMASFKRPPHFRLVARNPTAQQQNEERRKA